ncbi:hypothetical protein HID58_056558 [Brassica napus]|uniref:Uncharacterized protein n=1 Tax=Brassica napus TaxID=3708 RepID=A0ABQ8ANK5_BRANA|nr:hypothetical protein HID58_056558 [Brassica napus]
MFVLCLSSSSNRRPSLNLRVSVLAVVVRA